MPADDVTRLVPDDGHDLGLVGRRDQEPRVDEQVAARGREGVDRLRIVDQVDVVVDAGAIGRASCRERV